MRLNSALLVFVALKIVVWTSTSFSSFVFVDASDADGVAGESRGVSTHKHVYSKKKNERKLFSAANLRGLSGAVPGQSGSVDTSNYTEIPTVLSCNYDSVEISGNATILPNNIFSYVGEGRMCSSCEPLLRKVISAGPGSTEGTQLLKTEFATYSDLLEDNQIFDMSIADIEIEPEFGCAHSQNRRAMLRATDAEGGDKDSTPNSKPFARSLQTFPSSCSEFAKVNDGQCVYTECFVGGSATSNYDCFNKGRSEDNGCGNDLIDQLAGDVGTEFEAYSFSRPCCIHDFCYSTSSFDQETCDYEFYVDMLEECTSSLCGDVCAPVFGCTRVCAPVVNFMKLARQMHSFTTALFSLMEKMPTIRPKTIINNTRQRPLVTTMIVTSISTLPATGPLNVMPYQVSRNLHQLLTPATPILP